MKGTITLTQAQLRKRQVIDRYRSKAITRKKAAEMLGLSERQVTRLKKGVEAEGSESVINKNTGKTPAHARTAETKGKDSSDPGRICISKSQFYPFSEILETDCNLRWPAAVDAVTGGSPAAPAAGCKTLFHGALDMSLHRA